MAVFVCLATLAGLNGCSATGPSSPQNGPQTGSLQITVTGLPSGPAVIMVTGPSGFTQTVATTTTLSNLTPGVYTLTPSPVVVSNVAYAAPSITVNVTASLTPATTTVTYALAATGSLEFTLSGVPAGTIGSASLMGPGGSYGDVNTNQLLINLASGTYTITPVPLMLWYASYAAQPTTATVTASPVVTMATLTYVQGPDPLLPQGTVGQEYGGCHFNPSRDEQTYCGYRLGAGGDAGEPTWSWTAGPGSSLPPGLRLYYLPTCSRCEATEFITGLPTRAGTYTVVISATTGAIVTSHTFTITIGTP